MKQLLLILTAFLIMPKVFADGTKIGDLYYNLDSSSLTASVTYYAFDIDNPTVNSNYVKGVIAIPESVEYNGQSYSVTEIGESAFDTCTSLTSVTIPNSVTSIGPYAFWNCSGLTSVTIGNSVTKISACAFYGCTGLTSVEIPNSVTSIANRAFDNCTGLSSVEIPNSVTSIGSAAFWRCTGLTSATIGNSVMEIDGSAFYGCTGLTTVTIGNSVAEIGYAAFEECSGLTAIELPASLSSLGKRTFYNCVNLKTIIFNSDRLLTLDNDAFGDCNSLAEIYCNTVQPPVSEDFSVFANDVYSNANLYVPEKDLSLYQTATPWSKFYNISGTNTFPGSNGVESIEMGIQYDENASYYNLNGQIVKNPSPGIYIVGGKKIVVK